MSFVRSVLIVKLLAMCAVCFVSPAIIADYLTDGLIPALVVYPILVVFHWFALANIQVVRNGEGKNGSV